MPEDSFGNGAADVRVRQRTLTEMYGYAYRKADETGGRPGMTWLIYRDASGAVFAEDVANYFSTSEAWWPTDVMACEQATGRVLDIGCGAGRHALAVAQAGHEVVGVEPSRDAAAVARHRGVDARVGGLPDLPEELGSFDTFLLVGGGLHLLTAKEHQRTTLEQLAAVANPGAQTLGTMVLETGADGVTPSAPACPVRKPTYCLRVQHGAELTEWSAWSHHTAELTPAQLAEVVRGSGWTIDQIHYADFSFREYAPSAEQMAAMERGCAWTTVGTGEAELHTVTTYLARLRLID